MDQANAHCTALHTLVKLNECAVREQPMQVQARPWPYLGLAKAAATRKVSANYLLRSHTTTIT